jgi:DNA-binding NtrC family response regulator
VVIAEGGEPDQITEGGIATTSTGDHLSIQPASLQAAVARVMSSSRSSGFAWLLLEALVRGVGAERAAVLRLRGTSGPFQALLTYPAQSRVTIPRMLVEQVREQARGLRMDDGVVQLKIRSGRTRIETRLGSSMCVPLIRRSRVEALLYLDTQVRGAFRSTPMTMLEDLATTCYPALLAGLRVPLGGEASRRPVRRLIATSAAMKHTAEQAERCAASDMPYLIAGESGSGRDEVAAFVHQRSSRRDGPMVSLSCDSLPPERAESVMFGHEKGAFAGAGVRFRGAMEDADCGTLLLREIGDLPVPIQLKLLRSMQEGRFYRQGGSRPVHGDVRIVGATHHDLTRMIRDEEFREDLHYRLSRQQVDVPSLRDRPEDLEPLIARIMSQFNADLGLHLSGFEPGALEMLAAHRWRRNVRELEHVLRRVLLLCKGDEMDAVSVEAVLSTQVDPGGVDETLELGQTIRRVESRVLIRAMSKAGGRKTRAAAFLGISRESLDRRIAEYGIDLARALGQTQY